MIRSATIALFVILGACSAEEEESVDERFRRTEELIENTAQAFEAETENAVRETENLMENRADAAQNHVEATTPAESNETAENQTR